MADRNPAALRSLALKCEPAKEESRLLDAAIHALVHPDDFAGDAAYYAGLPAVNRADLIYLREIGVPNYTGSIDAAMKLVPSGWVVGEMSWWPHAKSAVVHMDDMHALKAASGAISLPLALCTAALRAIAATHPSEGREGEGM